MSNLIDRLEAEARVCDAECAACEREVPPALTEHPCENCIERRRQALLLREAASALAQARRDLADIVANDTGQAERANQAEAERDLIRQRYQQRFGAGADLAQVGQPTDEPDANGTAWAQIGYWKVRCDELSDSLAQAQKELHEWRGYANFLAVHGMAPPAPASGPKE
jgi:hypothetical protein